MVVVYYSGWVWVWSHCPGCKIVDILPHLAIAYRIRSGWHGSSNHCPVWI